MMTNASGGRLVGPADNADPGSPRPNAEKDGEEVHVLDERRAVMASSGQCDTMAR